MIAPGSEVITAGSLFPASPRQIDEGSISGIILPGRIESYSSRIEVAEMFNVLSVLFFMMSMVMRMRGSPRLVLPMLAAARMS
jgi:hypothetical protein